MKEKIPNKLLYFITIVLGLNFLYRLIDQSKLLFYFPLDFTNDISSYMAQLFFLAKCGFNNFCPYWYNGFIAFKFTPPGWYFFTYPLYLIFGDVKIATYISMILIFIIAFILIFYFGKWFKFSKLERIVFFFLVFANAQSIGTFIRLGRVHELFAWVNFIILFFILFRYKNKRIDRNFFYMIIPYSIIILSYQSTAILASFSLLGLFLAKRNKEKIKVVIAGLISLLITSFWWWPFLRDLNQSSIPFFGNGTWFWIFNQFQLFTQLAGFIFPLALLVLFFIYYKQNNNRKRELLFFLPSLILGILVLFRIIPLIPYLNDIFPDPYLFYFLFLALFLLFKIKLESKSLKNLILIALILLPIFSVGINIYHTPNFIVPDQDNQDIIDLLEEVDGTYIFIGKFNSRLYTKAYYSYAAIYLDLNSARGWYPQLTNQDYLLGTKKIEEAYRAENCEDLKDKLLEFNTTNLIGYKDTCNFLESCEFSEEKVQGDSCLYKIK